MPIACSRAQTNLHYAMLFLGVALVVFTAGYRLAGWSWRNALYMVPITDSWRRAAFP